MIRIERVRRLTPRMVAILDQLDFECFGDIYPKEEAMWWVAYDENRTPVGFAGAKYWRPDGCVYMCRVGVTKSARGAHLQRRFISVRLRWARAKDAVGVFTYTMPWNHASSNSLIARGFKLWSPSYQWAGKDVLYWYHGLGISEVPH